MTSGTQRLSSETVKQKYTSDLDHENIRTSSAEFVVDRMYPSSHPVQFGVQQEHRVGWTLNSETGVNEFDA